ncbi:MAG: hypothetical protein V4456_06220 [Bacteroidota bacterium]
MDFDDFAWHDSIIKKVEIDRSNPGICDTISIEIEWINGGNSKITFTDVYSAKLDMNFGVIASESIRSAYIVDDDNFLTELYVKWKTNLDGIKLHCYLIETNSTGSVLKIIAKGFEIHAL